MANHEHRQLESTKESLEGQSSAECTLSLQELNDALAGKPEQCHPSEVAAPRTGTRGRYARSKAGWASKERSNNREAHAWQFESPFPQGMSASSIMDAYVDAFPAPIVVCPPKKKRSPEERKAMKDKRIVQSERASVQHVEHSGSEHRGRGQEQAVQACAVSGSERQGLRITASGWTDALRRALPIQKS